MCWGKVRDELTNTVGVFVLPTAQDTDIFTAALQCTIHIYREDGATAAAAVLVSQLLSSCPGQLPNLLTSKCDFILVKAQLINP